MVKDYTDTTNEIIKLLKDNTAADKTLKDFLSDLIFEAGNTLDFNVPAPFVYVHFDLGDAVNDYIYKLEMEIFVGAEGKESSAEAKKQAMQLALKVMNLLREYYGIKFPKDRRIIEFFAEFSNRAVVQLNLLTEISFYEQD